MSNSLSLLLRVLPAAAVLSLPVGAIGQGGGEKKKCAIIIGLDGVRPDALQAAETPVMDALIKDGAVTWNAFAGGDKGGETEQKTSSGPGWSSILTGVWVNKHRVKDNSFSFNLLRRYPHFLARVKEARPDSVFASAVSWGPIEDEIVAPVADAFVFHVKGEGENYAEKDASVVDKVTAYLPGAEPDVLMLHLDQVDGAGHATGFSADNPVYRKAISTVDSMIGKVLGTIRSRPGYAGEDWLVVITTDHGGKGKGHGGQSDEERCIFVIASGGGVRAGQELSEPVGHTVVPVTVARHLGLQPDPSWGWEGEAFGLEDEMEGE